MVHADLALINGNIVTFNTASPSAEAVAIRQGRIIAVGSNDEILSCIARGTKKINLGSKTVVPGFIDTHIHAASLGFVNSNIDLRSVKSLKELQRTIAQTARKKRRHEWITGRGWDQDKLRERRYPSCLDLDQAVSDRPVFLLRVCGHIGVANSKAMKMARITKQTRPPAGGSIDLMEKTGEPSGILRERALNLIYRVLPKPSRKDLTIACQSACRRMLEEGITSAHWIISSPKELRALQELKRRNMLPVRVYAIIPVEYLDFLTGLGLEAGFGDEKIKIGSVKIMTDGSLGARTAALKRPYDDAKHNTGTLLYSEEELGDLVKRVHEARLQLAIHAIGDKAIDLVLRILENELGQAHGEDHRHRLEHASVLNPDLIRRMKKLGVVACVQPHFVISDFWISARLGKARARWTYAFRSLVKGGIVAMGGSDAPVEPVSPLLGVYASVAREAFEEEKLTVDEALRLYTINAAFGSFEEHLKGSIEPGKLGDLVVLSQNPYEISPERIREIEVEMTIVGGNVLYERRKGRRNFIFIRAGALT